MKARVLHRNERELLRIFFREKRPLTIREISIFSGMSWVTDKKYLNLMLQKDLLQDIRIEKRIKYKISDNLIWALSRRKKEGEIENAD